MAKTPRTWTGARNPSGLKRVRASKRRHEILAPRRTQAKTLVKKALAVATTRPEGADPQAALADAISALDLAAKSGAIHPNAAARRKSRLARKVNAAAGGAAQAKAAKARIAASKATKAKGAQTAAGKARAALAKTTRAEAAAAAAAAAKATESVASAAPKKAAPKKAAPKSTTTRAKAAPISKAAPVSKAATGKPAPKPTARKTAKKSE